MLQIKLRRATPARCNLIVQIDAPLEEPMIKLRYCLPLVPLVLSSCASAPPPAYTLTEPLTGSHALREQPNDPAAQCFAQLSGNPELQVLKGKVSLPEVDFAMGRTRPTREMLASTAMPSDAEMNAISAWDSAANECWSSGADWRVKHYPDSVNREIDKHVANVKALVAELSTGKISYGEYARAWTTEASSYKNDIVAIAETMESNRGIGAGYAWYPPPPMGGYPLGNTIFH
jgi:hypothetical protein